MPSANKTETLRLSQWELSEPLLMEDLNGDFRRIDEAIPRVKLIDIELDEPIATIQMDFSEMDMSRFIELEFYFNLMSLSTTSNKAIRINNIRSCYQYYASSSTSADKLEIANGKFSLAKCGKLLFFSGGKWCADGYITLPNESAQIETVLLFATDQSTFPAGSSFAVYGVKR